MEKNEEEHVGHICLTLKEGMLVQVGDDVQVLIKEVRGHGIGKAVRIVIMAPVSKKIFKVKQA